VGSVIPVNAAGSLFTGFMSVANIAYSFSFASGSWLYTNGMHYSVFRGVQKIVFGIPSNPGDKMSFALLILISAVVCLFCFAVVHKLPDKTRTKAMDDLLRSFVGPEQFKVLGASFLRLVNISTLLFAAVFFCTGQFIWKMDIITNCIVTFFIPTFFRKVFLDWRYRYHIRHTSD
jgi:hypothetical protein